MKQMHPDYTNITKAAFNQETKRVSLYEHTISTSIMEQVLEKKIEEFRDGDERDRDEFYSSYCQFYHDCGYDTVSFECCIGAAMPGSGALGNSRVDPVIKNRADFDAYPWKDIPNIYFDKNGKHFEALRKHMPAGMKAIGGVGNGIFECVQELVGYENLCYLAIDDEELYHELFRKVGETNLAIWKRFMKEYGDIYCVLRFGDDMGFKSTTLLSKESTKADILPMYKPIIDLVHSYNKPFLLHSCGNIFSVMDDIISTGINAKHSNEDQIALFPEWVTRYGDKIGNFGGIDVNVICNYDKSEMREYITDVFNQCKGRGGFAFGSGNSIPDYVPMEGYLNMLEIVQEIQNK
jgi:uroporphyrinogen decarboxylase